MDFIAANITQPSEFVMKAVRPGDHFILISTAGALFDGTFEVRTSSAYCPKNFYGATKAAEEMVLEKLVELRGGSFSVIRMTNVYGCFSDKKKSAIHAFTRAVIEGREVFINGDGKQSRDFIYAGDVGRAIAEQARRVRAGEAYERVNMIGAGVSTSLMDVVGAIEAAERKEPGLQEGARRGASEDRAARCDCQCRGCGGAAGRDPDRAGGGHPADPCLLRGALGLRRGRGDGRR